MPVFVCTLKGEIYQLLDASAFLLMIFLLSCFEDSAPPDERAGAEHVDSFSKQQLGPLLPCFHIGVGDNNKQLGINF